MTNESNHERRKLLGALVHLDRHGVAHRDLKMASLMLRKGSADGDVIVMDFGMAGMVARPHADLMYTQCGTVSASVSDLRRE